MLILFRTQRYYEPLYYDCVRVVRKMPSPTGTLRIRSCQSTLEDPKLLQKFFDRLEKQQQFCFDCGLLLLVKSFHHRAFCPIQTEISWLGLYEWLFELQHRIFYKIDTFSEISERWLRFPLQITGVTLHHPLNQIRFYSANCNIQYIAKRKLVINMLKSLISLVL